MIDQIIKTLNWLEKKQIDRRSKYQNVGERTPVGLHEYLFGYFSDIVPNSSQILDLGSGRGAWALRLNDNGYKVTAADLDSQQSKVPCICVNLNEDFADKFTSSFDAVTAIEILEHLENPRHTLRQINSLLNQGGKLMLSTPNASGLYSRIKFLLTGRFCMFDDEGYYRINHIRPISFW